MLKWEKEQAPNGAKFKRDRQGFLPELMEKFYDGRGYDMLLTNTDKGHSDLVSLSMAKAWENWDIYASYTWQDVQTVGNLSSSRNISNFKYTTKYMHADIIL